MPESASAEEFVAALLTFRSDEEREKHRRYFKMGEGEYGEGDEFAGVRMGQVHAIAKTFIDMPPVELEKLLENPIHEVRAGAMSIMDKEGRRNKTPESRCKELFDLYLRRHDRINNWDLVDLGAPLSTQLFGETISRRARKRSNTTSFRRYERGVLGLPAAVRLRRVSSAVRKAAGVA